MNKFDILLGYDDPQTLEAIGWALEEKGYNITRVPNAEGLLEALAKSNFDLVLVDIDLHKIDDIDVLHEVKEFHPETMVIVLCCKDDVAYSHDALRVEADDYIFKPCSKAKLWKRVANCLERLELKRSNAPLEPHGCTLNEHVLNILRITLEEVKGPITLTEEILELVNWGAYGGMEEKVRTKLNELYKIVSGLNRTVEELLGKASKITENLSTEQKIPDWKEDTINPVLGNIPG